MINFNHINFNPYGAVIKIGRKLGSSNEDIDRTIKILHQILISALFGGDEFNQIAESMPGIFSLYCQKESISMGELRNKVFRKEFDSKELFLAINLWGFYND